MPLAQQKRKQAPAKKEEVNEDDLGLSEEHVDEKPKKQKKKALPKEEKSDVPKHETDENGWNTIIQKDGALIYKVYSGFKPTPKLAALDLDGTLVTVKGRQQFPINADDFKFFSKQVPKKLKELTSEGYSLVIFSNQNSIKGALKGAAATKVKQRIDNIQTKIKEPMAVFAAPQQDRFRKPNTGMWEYYKKNIAKTVQVDMKSSFFAGDAAGRKDDFDKTDREFAQNIKLSFKVPEDLFGEGEGKKTMDLSKLNVSASDSKNPDLVDLFERLAEYHLSGGGNAFAGRAYQKSAKIIAAYDQKITESKQLAKIAGIGKGTMGKIDEFRATGTVSEFSEKKDDDQNQSDGEKNNNDNNGAMNFL